MHIMVDIYGMHSLSLLGVDPRGGGRLMWYLKTVHLCARRQILYSS